MALSTLFISHAHADQKLADTFGRLLEGGINLSQKQIFCTSLEEQGIPAGEDFKAFIQKKLAESKIVIALISENYYASAFCMCELGATWVTAKNFIPFIVPPLSFADLKGVLSGMQVLRLDDSGALDQARDRIAEIAEDPAGTARWTTRKGEFLKGLNQLLKGLPRPKVIKPEEFEKLKSEKADYCREYEQADKENQTLKKKIEDLKKTKDKAQVAAVERKYSSEWDAFDDLVEKAAKHLSRFDSVVVEALFQRFRGADFRPSAERWGDDPMDAVEEGLLDVDEDEGTFNVNENDPKIKKSLAALRELRRLLDEEASEGFHTQYEHKFDETLDMKLRPFWDRHLRS